MKPSTRPRCLAALLCTGALWAFDAHQSRADDVLQEVRVLENPWENAGGGPSAFQFGRSIAFDQGRLLVGDPLSYKHDAGRKWGRSVLFPVIAPMRLIHGEDPGPSDQTSCTAEDDGGACHRFGTAVDLEWPRAAVSSPWRADPARPDLRPDLGRVSIIRLDQGDRIEHVLEPSDSRATRGFGYRVVLRDDVLLVGITDYEGGVDVKGGVEVFDADGFTSLGMLPRPMIPFSTGFFGKAIAADEGSNQVIIGSVPESGTTDAGSAHVYAVGVEGKYRPARIELLASFLPPVIADPEEAYDDFDGFGSAVAIDGVHAAVSAPRRQGGGAVVLYRKDVGGAWSQFDVIEPPEFGDVEQVLDFGHCLEFHDGVLYVGAPGTSFTTGWNQTGAVFGIPVESAGCVRLYRSSEERRELLGTDIEIEDGHLYASAPGGETLGFGRVLVFRIPVSADVNQDGTVDVADLLAVIGAWGPCTGSCPSDTNCDGQVDVKDLLEVIAEWHGLALTRTDGS